MLDAGGIEAVDLRKGELKHHLLIFDKRVESQHKTIEQDFFSFTFFGAVDVYLRLENWDQTVSDDLLSDFELLLNDFLNSFGIRFFYNRAHFCTEDAHCTGSFQGQF